MLTTTILCIGPYLSVLHYDRARISKLHKMKKYSVISRKLITRFPIIFISVETKFTYLWKSGKALASLVAPSPTPLW